MVNFIILISLNSTLIRRRRVMGEEWEGKKKKNINSMNLVGQMNGFDFFLIKPPLFSSYSLENSR